jgi:hypothetical protein
MATNYGYIKAQLPKLKPLTEAQKSKLKSKKKSDPLLDALYAQLTDNVGELFSIVVDGDAKRAVGNLRNALLTRNNAAGKKFTVTVRPDPENDQVVVVGLEARK